MKEDRYKNIPISEQTRKGMTLTIDDLAAISRLLTLQDDVYEEEFEDIKKSLDKMNRSISSLNKKFGKLCEDLEKTQQEVGELKAS